MTAPEQVIDRLVPPFAAAGLAIARGGRLTTLHTRAAPGLTLSGATLWRAASISKMVTGRVARLVLPDPDRPAEPQPGWVLTHPAAPGRAVTVGELASHTAGLTDAAGYALPAGGDLRAFVEGTPGVWGAQPPGAVMRYANLSTVLLAGCAEVATGERFDRLARRLVLAPWGLRAGFNWSGLRGRGDRMPLFRRGAAGLVAQIDAEVGPAGVAGPDGQAQDLRAWRPGGNPGVFSPQGGLRLSLAGAVRLARRIGQDPGPWLWHGQCPADDPGGMFQAYGWGVMRLDRPDIYPRPLIGHFANAYGLCAGAWHDPARDLGFAYLLNGLALDDEDDALRAEELALFRAVAKVAA